MPTVVAGGRELEIEWHGSSGGAAPLVFLHEGLGSVSSWRDFPARVAEVTGRAALVYSRAGHGRSQQPLGPRAPGFMDEEAVVLGELLDAAGVGEAVLFGHSDGASIALIHAAASGRPVHGLVLMAPHVFIEAICLESIARIRDIYFGTDLEQRLAKYHAHVDDAFLGWADTWLLPEFRSWSIEDLLPAVSQPMLLIQGRDDEYGTLAQLDRIEARVKGPTSRLVLADCGHSPQRDQEAAVIEAIAAFVGGLSQERRD